MPDVEQPDIDQSDGDAVVGGPTLLRSSGVVALGTALSRGTGFLKLAALAYALGFGALTDTYTLANTTPNIVYELLLGGVLSAMLVPVFVHHHEDRDDESTSAVITITTVALIAITVVGIVAAPILVRLYTVTANGAVAAEQRAVATSLLRLFMPQMAFYGLTAVGTALLNSRRRFAAPAYAPVLNNLVVTAMLFALPHVAGHTPTLHGVHHDRGLLLLLGLGTTAGIAAMTIALLPPMLRSGYRFRPNFDWRNPAVREVSRMSGWTLGYVLNNQAALLIVLLLANREVGGVATYTGAQIFFLLPHALVAVSIMTTFQPELARAARADDRARFTERFSSGVRLMALVIIPASVGYVVLAKPIVVALLRRGALTRASADLTADNLALLAVGLCGYSLYLFTLRGFYALKDTRTPFFINVAENGINVVLAFALEPVLGVPGLALSFALAYVVAAGFAVTALRSRMGPLGGPDLVRTLVRITVASAVMGGTVALAIRFVGDDAIVQTAVGVAVGSVVFAAAISAMHVREVDQLRARQRRH
ncbi:MAG: murein biosynthesis integral membrane protein MurJ [Acidobacteria bacterium]|nr:murein biosynthesis integral membrane protein MurJ [Acidobacteriota bacterium]